MQIRPSRVLYRQKLNVIPLITAGRGGSSSVETSFYVAPEPFRVFSSLNSRGCQVGCSMLDACRFYTLVLFMFCQ